MSHVHDARPVALSLFYDDGVVRGHILGNHRVRSDPGAAPDAHRTDHPRARADRHVVLDNRPAEEAHLVHESNAAPDARAALDDYAERIGHEHRRAKRAADVAIEIALYAGNAVPH